MTKIPTPRSLEAATALAADFSATAAAIAGHEADRQAAIAATDAAVDALVAPLVARRDGLAAALAPWWTKAGPGLTEGKRKSIELGGCKIGTRTEREKLEFAGGDDKAALAAVVEGPHKGTATTLKRVLDKAGILAAIKGKGAGGTALRALGFRVAGGGDVFFVSRVDSGEAKVGAR